MGIILPGILFIVLAVVTTVGGYYLVSGDWLWERDKLNRDPRNWSPPR